MGKIFLVLGLIVICCYYWRSILYGVSIILEEIGRILAEIGYDIDSHDTDINKNPYRPWNYKRSK